MGISFLSFTVHRFSTVNHICTQKMAADSTESPRVSTKFYNVVTQKLIIFRYWDIRFLKQIRIIVEA